MAAEGDEGLAMPLPMPLSIPPPAEVPLMESFEEDAIDGPNSEVGAGQLSGSGNTTPVPGLSTEPPEGGGGQKRPLEDSDSSPGSGARKWPGWPGESVFRLIVPMHKVGSIIGRRGEFVKKMCEETRSRIKIVEGVPGADERVVLVSSKEEPDADVPPAVEGLLRVHRQVVEGPEVDGKAPPPPEVLVGTITARLLVPASQAGSLIGRQGTTIRNIQDGSGANVRVLPEDDLPMFALEEDRVVEVSGPVRSVYKGLELILSHLRRFLVDRSVVPLFERPAGARAQLQGPPRGLSPDYTSSMGNWGAPPLSAQSAQRSYPPPAASPLAQDYPYGGSATPPPGSYSASTAAVLADLAGQRNAVSLYGRDPALSRPSPVQQAPPVAAPVVSIKEVTACMQVPISYADAIIGVGGSNILYLRRTSGATVSVQETRSSSGSLEMSVEIRGTTHQVQTAEQLLQSFMAGQSGYQAGAAAAGASGPGSSAAYSADPYGSYGSGASQYAPPAQPASPSYDPAELYYQRASLYSSNPETSYPNTYGY